MSFSSLSKATTRARRILRGHVAGEAGFTLLEVLISIVLLVVISLAIYNATTETFRLREILQNEGEFYNGIRLSMGILDRDVSLLYSPALILPDKAKGEGGDPAADQAQALRDQQEATELSNAGLDRASEFWTGMLDKTGVRGSRFVGTDAKITFISASHIRLYKESRESDFAKITYELQDDRNSSETRILVKKSDSNVFEDEDRPGNNRDKRPRIYPLLSGVKKIKFRYFRKEKDRWEDRWDSDSQDTKNLYPDAIEVAIEVAGPSRLFFEGIYRFRPEIPLRGVNANL